jgi:DNA repair exonuclease SbcCD ATPase subunit
MKLIHCVQEQHRDAALLPPGQSTDSLGVSATVEALTNKGSGLLHAMSPVKMPSVQPNINNLLLKAFDAQRTALQEQASSSNDITLTALACLEKRHGHPAPGGLKIPFSGMGLLGGRKSARSATKSQLKELKQGLTDVRETIEAQRLAISATQEKMANMQAGSGEHRDLATRLTEQQSRLNALDTQANALSELISRLEQELRAPAAPY